MRLDCTTSSSELPGFPHARRLSRRAREPEFAPDALCRGRDGALIRNVELEGERRHPLFAAVSSCSRLRDSMSAAKPWGREALRDLPTDSFVGPR